jgi:hypothetical protein
MDEPGTYEAQAVYRLPDGRRLASAVQRVRVLNPHPEVDRLAADFFSTATGTYLGLEGSRIDAMARTRERLGDIAARVPQSAVARQIAVVNALRDSRVFKDVKGRRVQRPDGVKAAEQLLRALRVDRGARTVALDATQSHLRVGRVLKRAARAFAVDGSRTESGEVIATLENMLTAVQAPAQALQDLKAFQEGLVR